MRQKDYFQFKQFGVNQQGCAMKVGTDGVLLGSWVDVSDEAKHILDIGTGTGLIALMLAQKSKAYIDAVEIEPSAAVQATNNFMKSPWAERMKVFPVSFQDFTKSSLIQYDIIVSNPPYFKSSLLAPDAQKNLARHDNSLSTEELLNGVHILLKDTGFFCLIIPTIDVENTKTIALQFGLMCNKETIVYPTPKHTSKRTLLCFKYTNTPTISNCLIIEQSLRGNYTDDYKNLTKDFYLHF